MRIVKSKQKIKKFPLADMAVGDDVFIIMNDDEEEPCIRIDPHELCVIKGKPGTKSKRKIDFDVSQWLDDNGLFAVVSLDSGAIYVYDGDEEVILWNAELRMIGEKNDYLQKS